MPNMGTGAAYTQSGLAATLEGQEEHKSLSEKQNYWSEQM